MREWVSRPDESRPVELRRQKVGFEDRLDVTASDSFGEHSVFPRIDRRGKEVARHGSAWVDPSDLDMHCNFNPNRL